MNCESCQALIIDAMYDNNELPKHRALNLHIDSCSVCTDFHNELNEGISTLRSKGLNTQNYEDIPQRAALESLWEDLQPSLDKVDAEKFRKLPKKSYSAATIGLVAMAACLVLFVGILQQPSQEQPSPLVAQDAVNPEVMNYLNRAQVMLLQVANSSAPQAMDIPMSQTFARDMALEASFLNTDNNNAVNSGQKKLLRDVEFLLTQIANLDESNAALGVDLLQRFLEEKNILFKIRLLELREKQNLI